MKIICFSIVLFCIILQSDLLLTEEYYRARTGYEYASLKLYKKGGYFYHYWMHSGYYLQDIGSFVKSTNTLVLTSFISKMGNTRKKKTKQEKIFRYFSQDSLQIRADTIIMLSKGEHSNEMDSASINRRVLYKRKE